MAKNPLKKQLRQPDEFVTFWARAGAAAAERRKPIAVGVVALAVAVGGVLVLSEINDRGATRASRAFARIQKIAIAGLIPAEGEPPKFEDDLPHFKSDSQRREATLKELDAFLDTHKGSALKDEALLLKAGFLLDLGKPDEAIGFYDQLLGGSLDKRLRFLAHEGAGYAHEAKGQIDQAIASFARLGDEAGTGFYKDRALYQKARLTEKKGDRKAAEKIYREVLDKMPTTPLRDQISNRLAALESK